MHAISYFLIMSIVVTALGLFIYALSIRGYDTEGLGAGLAAVGCVALLFSTIFAGIAAVDSTQCRTYAHESGVDYRYGLNAGCRLELEDGRFVPEDRWRVTEERGD